MGDGLRHKRRSMGIHGIHLSKTGAGKDILAGEVNIVGPIF
jgi:hypothetical protein